MSDTQIQGAWRRWRADPSAENALAWAQLQNRTQALGPSVADAFGLKDAWGKRAVRIVSKAMVLLHGVSPPRLAELALAEVARLSKKQWRDMGECGQVTLGEIKTVLEANGLTFSEKDDEVVSARLATSSLNRAVEAANSASMMEALLEAREERDEALDDLVETEKDLAHAEKECKTLRAALVESEKRLRAMRVEQVAIGGRAVSRLKPAVRVVLR